MAKSTIEQLRKQNESAAAEAAKKAQKVQEQESALRDLKHEQEAAATAGDFDKYEELAARIAKAERILYVMNHEKPKAGAVTEEQAREAWADYASGWAREMAKRWGLYKTALRELCHQYEGLVKFQNDALKIRREVAEMIGADPESFTLEGWLPNRYLPNFPANFGGLHVPEMAFFGQYEEWPENYNRETGRRFPAEGTLWAIVARHEPIDNPTF